MSSKQNERFSGLFITTMGGLLTVWNWQLAFSNGRFYPKIAVMGPVLIIAGLSIILFPDRLTVKSIGRQININGSNGSTLSPTPLGWGVIATAFGSGFLNLAVLEGWHLID
jgi:hypothetical protein